MQVVCCCCCFTPLDPKYRDGTGSFLLVRAIAADDVLADLTGPLTDHVGRISLISIGLAWQEDPYLGQSN
jgi:hypothetical protein